jgi:tetratricopeptide (TPR) repeat protein
VRLAYARALVADARYDDARDEFKILLKANPDNPDVLFAIGILSLQLNDMDMAEKNLKKVVALGQGELDTARFYLGQIAEHAGHRDEALDWYRAVAGGEQQLPAHVRAAQLLVEQNQLDEAREQLEIARSGAAEDSRLVIAQAQLFRQQNRHAEAYALLQSALAEHANDPELLYETALAADKVNDVVKMEQYLRRLIELKPEEATAYNALGYSLADRNLRLPEAAALIDKALSLAPDDAFILDSKGWVLFRQGRLDEALALLKKAYASRPDPEIAAHTGEVLWQLGRRDEALRIWREAEKKHPDNEALKAVIKRFLP